MNFNKEEYQKFLNTNNVEELERYFAEYKKVIKETSKMLSEEFKNGLVATSTSGESTDEIFISDKGIKQFIYYLDIREKFFKLYTNNLMKYSAPIYSSFLNTKEITEHINQQIENHHKHYNSDITSFLSYDEVNKRFKFIISQIYDEKFGIFFEEDKSKKSAISSIEENGKLSFSDTENIYSVRKYFIDGIVQDNSKDFPEQMSNEFKVMEDKISFFKGVKKFIDETSQSEHDYLSGQLGKISQRYNMNLNYSGNDRLDNYGENNKADRLVPITKKGFFENLSILEEQMQGALLAFGKNFKNSLKNIFINVTNGAITDKENNVGLCVSSNKNYEINQEEPVFIQIKLQRHAGSVLSHELAHAFDRNSKRATDEAFINQINSENNEKIDSKLLYSSNEYFLNIAKELNPIHVFQNIEDDFIGLNEKVPEFKELQEAKKKLYGHQFFGDENLNFKDLKSHEQYSVKTKEVALEYAANMFNKILDETTLIKPELKELINKNPELRVSLFQTIKENVEGSILPHFIIAQNMKESFSFFKDKPLEIEKNGVSIINFKTLGTSGENGYKEQVDFANKQIVDGLIKQINKLSELMNVKDNMQSSEEKILRVARDSLNDVFSRNIGKEALIGLDAEIIPTHIINYTNEKHYVSFASAVDFRKAPNYILDTFNETLSADCFYKYMADPTEISSRYTQAFAEKSFIENMSRVSKRTDEFLKSSINIVGKAMMSFSRIINTKLLGKNAIIIPEYSNFKTLDSKIIDNVLIEKNQKLQDKFLNAMSKLNQKQKEMTEIIAASYNKESLACYANIGNKNLNENNGFFRLESIVKEKNLLKGGENEFKFDKSGSEIVERIKMIEDNREIKENVFNKKSTSNISINRSI